MLDKFLIIWYYITIVKLIMKGGYIYENNQNWSKGFSIFRQS